jgi:hypothetical protein
MGTSKNAIHATLLARTAQGGLGNFCPYAAGVFVYLAFTFTRRQIALPRPLGIRRLALQYVQHHLGLALGRPAFDFGF